MSKDTDKNIAGVKNSQSGRSIGKMLRGGKKGGSQTTGGYSGNSLRPKGKRRFPQGKYKVGID